MNIECRTRNAEVPQSTASLFVIPQSDNCLPKLFEVEGSTSWEEVLCHHKLISPLGGCRIKIKATLEGSQAGT